MQGSDLDVGVAAAENLADQALLTKVALEAVGAQARAAAAAKLTDRALLEKIREEDGDGAVRMAAAEALAVPLVEALRAGLVEARAEGAGIEAVRLRISRKGEPLTIGIPPGTLFVNTGSAQDMVATEYKMVVLIAESDVVLVDGACANMYRPIPSEDSSFSIAAAARSKELRALAPLLRGEPYSVKQAALWIVSDNASRFALARLQRVRQSITARSSTPVISD